MARYRPYVVVAVAALLIVFVPRRHGDSDASDGSGAPRVASAATSPEAGDGGTVPTTPSSGGAGGPASVASPRRPTAAAPGTPARGAAPAATGAGIGTPTALASPDCDTKTGLLKISFIWRPPCVVPWPKGADNGGTTSMGVTATTIKIVWVVGQAESQSDSDQQRVERFKKSIEVFEHFYRMWGRHVEVTIFHPSGADEVAQRADAVELANMKPFAVVQTVGDVLETELASRGVICIDTAQVSVKRSMDLAPFLWGPTIQPSELVQLNSAEYVGRRLLGKPARWAGQLDYQQTVRRFGLVHPDNWDTKVFADVFAKYGGRLTDDLGYSPDQASWGERAQVLAARLKSKGVTSVIAGTDLLFTGVLTQAAAGQNWFPEWITTGFGAQDLDVIASTYNQAQWRHAFGVAGIPMGGTSKVLFPQTWFYKWYWGVDPVSEGNIDTATFHSDVPVLYAGIHGAGPHLTPETFRDGNFARPPQGGVATGAVIAAQNSYGRWGVFPWDDYNAFDDFDEVWWNATAVAPDVITGQQTAGHYRHMNGGRRYLAVQWPLGEPRMFDTAGTALTYDEYPPNDRPPDFPCTGCPSERR